MSTATSDGPSTPLSEDARTDDLGRSITAYLSAALADPDLTLSDLRRFGTGHSGDTYSAEMAHRGDVAAIVARLSPAGVRIAGPADVGRQGRIMGALHDHGLPAPRVLAADSSGAIDGRSIAVMERLTGEEWTEFADRHSHRATARAATSALAAVQSVPLAACGIPDDPRLTPQQEVARWVPLIERGPADLQESSTALRDDLARTVERSDPSAPPVLVHGDFHFGNLLFGPSEVRAVFDWEIAGLGHPLTDLACLGVAALRRRYEPEPNPTGSVHATGQELAELYGADPDALAWHLAASCFKYAAILAYNLQLFRRGRLNEPIYAELQATTAGLLADGQAALAGGLSALWPSPTAP